jgi:hypothetical protein
LVIAAGVALSFMLLAGGAVRQARSSTALAPAPHGWAGTCRAGGVDCLPDADAPAGEAVRQARSSGLAAPEAGGSAYQVAQPNERYSGAGQQAAATASRGDYQVAPPNERDSGAAGANPAGDRQDNAEAAAALRARSQPGIQGPYREDHRADAAASGTGGTTNQRGAGRAHQRFLEVNELPETVGAPAGDPAPCRPQVECDR